jgi:hypothetical protein
MDEEMDIVTKDSPPESTVVGVNEKEGQALLKKLTEEFNRKEKLAQRFHQIFDTELKKNVVFDKKDPRHLELFVQQHQRVPLVKIDTLAPEQQSLLETDYAYKEYSLSPLDKGMEAMKDATDLLGFYNMLDFSLSEKEHFHLTQQVLNPLMNVPIRVPALFLLIKRNPWPAIVDAIYVLKTYKATVLHLSQTPFINNTIEFSCAWLRETFKEKVVDAKNVELFMDSLAYHSSDNKIWTVEELFKQKVPQEFKDSLRFVNSPVGCPWRPSNVDFADMIVEELPAKMETLGKELKSQTLALFGNKPVEDLGQWTSDVDARFLFLYLDYIVEVLRVYEVCILRLLSKTCYSLFYSDLDVAQKKQTLPNNRGIDLKSIPRDIVCASYNFKTPSDAKEFCESIHPAIMTTIDREREEIFAIRNSIYFGMNVEKENVNDNMATLFGSTIQRFTLARYIAFDDSKNSRKDLADYLEEISVAVHTLMKQRHSKREEKGTTLGGGTTPNDTTKTKNKKGKVVAKKKK